MNEIDYEKLADAVANKLRLLPPPEKIIWNAKQCADYFGISERHFTDRVSKNYDFPAAIKLPNPDGTRGHSRWHAAEVQEWATRQKKAS
jgi:predicted DNA-binding transcriptional regulator AlpA